MATGSARWQLGSVTFSDLQTEMEVAFGDVDRERKLISRFQSFTQVKDLAAYISGFRSLRLELGSLVTDESALWQFVTGLKMELKREVLREKSLLTLSDAILAAERADAVEKFVRFGARGAPVRTTTPARASGPVPMDIDAMRTVARPPARGRGNMTRGRSFARGKTPQYSQDRTRQSFGSRQRNDNNTCYYCGKPGHWAKDCYKKKNQQGTRRVHFMEEV